MQKMCMHKREETTSPSPAVRAVFTASEREKQKHRRRLSLIDIGCSGNNVSNIGKAVKARMQFDTEREIDRRGSCERII